MLQPSWNILQKKVSVQCISVWTFCPENCLKKKVYVNFEEKWVKVLVYEHFDEGGAFYIVKVFELFL